jgi:hypothetical protein
MLNSMKDRTTEALTLNAAVGVFEAATALIETRLSAIRQSVDIEDTQVVIDTEALAARAASWRAEVGQALRLASDAAAIASDESALLNAEPRHRAVIVKLTSHLSQMEQVLEQIESDGGEAIAEAMKTDFKKDRVFAHLLKKRTKRPDQSFPLVDRLIAKWARFSEGIERYERNASYLDRRKKWLAEVRDEILEVKSEIAAAQRGYNDTSRAAMIIRDEATLVARRGLNTLFDLLSEDSPEFSELDLDAACGVAREAAAAGLRSGNILIPFAVEQEQRLAELNAKRREFKLYLDTITAIS